MRYGRYDIVEELGGGSMGVVYKALDPQINRLVALKVMRPDRVTNPDFRKRFLKEAQAVGRLSHPNVVTVYDMGEDHGQVFIAMEFVEGKPLDRIIRDKSFTLREMLDIGIQAAKALDYAHSRGVVHRDIKPSNILVQSDGVIKITDFGIAHIENPEATQLTQTGDVLGTPAYMAPEQVLGQPVDGRSDLYSLGVILYEMAAGKRPFKGENIATIFQSIIHENPESPVKTNPSLHGELSQIIMKCLAKSPDLRFATGRTLADALEKCQESSEAATMTARASVESITRPLGRFVVVPLVFLIVVCFAGVVYFYWIHFPEKKREELRTGSVPGMQDAKSEPTALHPSPVAGNDEALPSDIKTGLLKITTFPIGAHVIIDGERKGTTPLEIRLPSGHYELRLNLEGYGDWAASVKIAENALVQVPVDLLPLSPPGFSNAPGGKNGQNH